MFEGGVAAAAASIALSKLRAKSVGVYRSASSILNRSRTSCGLGVSTGSAVTEAERGVSPVLGIIASNQSAMSMFISPLPPIAPDVDGCELEAKLSIVRLDEHGESVLVDSTDD